MPLRPLRTWWFIALVAALASVSAAARAATTERDLLAASGVPAEQLDRYTRRLDELTAACRAAIEKTADHPAAARTRAQAIHAFLHRHVLTGHYDASASNLGIALDGGPFNCAATSTLFATLAARLGLEVEVLSIPGHVWCAAREQERGDQVSRGASLPLPPFSSFILQPSSFRHVETTNRDWFAIRARSAGLPTDQVSPAMAAHRRRVASGRVLTADQLQAIFHFNRGVTHLRHSNFPAALLANLRALTLDPQCVPAWENLGFAAQNLLAGGKSQ